MSEVGIYNDLACTPKVIRIKRDVVNQLTGERYKAGSLLRMPFVMARRLWIAGACEFMSIGDILIMIKGLKDRIHPHPNLLPEREKEEE